MRINLKIKKEIRVVKSELEKKPKRNKLKLFF